MQLKGEGFLLRRRLVAASCALLGATSARAQDADSPDPGAGEWTIDSALAYYHENGRIQAIEPVVDLRKDYGNGELRSVRLSFDSLSGSSPNGALPSRKAQTFATPSGKSLSAAPTTYTTASGQTQVLSAPVYTTRPGQLPVDPNYRDQRLAVAGSWTLPLDRLTVTSAGGKLSYEHDFYSASVNGSIARDFDEKNTTVSLGLNGEFDSVRPIGGAPLPASDYALFDKTGDKHKDGAGALFGVTQVITRNWLAELNLSADRFTGYLNDPYKIISVIDVGGNTTGYLYEKRPSERLRRSAYLENRIGWSRVSAALSLRYMTDDWRVRSQTADFHVRVWSAGKDWYLQPSLRWYRQNAAYFYTPWLTNTGGQISYASADQRLGSFDARTYGMKYALKLDDSNSELSFRLEYYEQTQRDRMPGPGSLQGLDLYPGLKAVLLQVGWRF